MKKNYLSINSHHDITSGKRRIDNPLLFTEQQHYFKDYDDEEIWFAFQNGHEGAFTYIYEHYFDTLYQYGCQFTRDTAIVEDLLQDFFVSLRLSRQQEKRVYCIKAYLLKSFRRKVIRHLKKKNPIVFTEEFAEDNFKITFVNDMPFMKKQFHKEQQKHISQLLNNLTSRQREAVYYFYFENLDYKNVSLVMGLSSAKSARNLIYRALSCLKKKKHLFPEWLKYNIMISL